MSTDNRENAMPIDKINDVKLQVSLLEKDVQMSAKLVEKISESIEKIQEMNLNLVKMITLHEQRHTQHEKTEDALKDDIKEIRKEIQYRFDQVENHITDRIDALRNELIQSKTPNSENKKLTDKINDIEHWRWMIAGGIMLAGWILGNLDLVGKFFR